MKKEKIKKFAFLHAVLFLYSLISVVSKAASQKESFGFLLGYVIVLALLFVYAVLWQIVLKKFSLSMAFANKAIVIVWGLVWGTLLYGEVISIRKMVGALIIVVGIIYVVKDDE